MRPLISFYAVLIKDFVFVPRGGVNSHEVSEPSQASLGAVVGAFSAKSIGLALVR